MKMVLASGGVTNPTIRNALVTLLDKPIEESTALCIPTAMHALGERAPRLIKNFVSQGSDGNLVGLPWKSIGVIELTALPSLGSDSWKATVLNSDCLVVSGGDPLFLNYWMDMSGLTELLSEFDGVWLGQSAGSMIMAPWIGEVFPRWQPPEPVDRTLGLVDFAIFPHLDYPGWESNTMAEAEKWAANLPFHSYALDEESAIVVDGDNVRVVSEGNWRYFPK